jgi:C-terminal processing protease CtpA/Prc
VPLYILIGKNTFSAAEEFAYNLKHLKRAIVVGEPSKGGAHPWQWFSLSPDMRVAIPVSMAINPVTKTNWEGKGVIPTIRTEEGNALIHAYNSLLQWRAKNENNAFELEEILQTLDEVSGSESVNTSLKSE